VKRHLIIAALLITGVCVCRLAWGQTPPTNDVLGAHSLTLGSESGGAYSGGLGCTACHAPHSGLPGGPIAGVTALWNQQLSQQTYTPYTSATYYNANSKLGNKGNTQPTLGVTSSLCLSCHDGTVAIGQTAAYGQIPVGTSKMPGMSKLGNNGDLSASHPFSLILPMQDSPDLVANFASSGVTQSGTACPSVKLVNGNMECTSCHDPHIQGTDPVAQNFLLCDSSSGKMCLTCHDPNRVTQGSLNLLSGWTNSIHMTATNGLVPSVQTSQVVGPYATVGLNACSSCHMEHNGSPSSRLLRPSTSAASGIDAATQSCINCHSNATVLSPAAPDVFTEFGKISHPLPSGANLHDEAEPALLNNNRHSTCVDCHSPHGSNQMTSFTPPPGLRMPQSNAIGVSATDGATPLTPAVNQYETCFRCHGTSTGKQVLIKYGYLPTRLVFSGDPLNLLPQFSVNSTSSHPVVHPRSSPLPQPSLLTYMLNLNGTNSTRQMAPGSQIFCTDCHASDDNREFSGTNTGGPTGPHGSIYPHILERNYQFSQAAVPGGTVTNTYPNPDLSQQGPYAMCAKCHDLGKVIANTSWTQHGLHVSTGGFSCSVCHTAHGMGAVNPGVTGERLVNFDIAVVGQSNGAPITYNRGSNTCTLTCHNAAHNPNGTVTVNGSVLPQVLSGPKH